jgi:hypothetical protein
VGGGDVILLVDEHGRATEVAAEPVGVDEDGITTWAVEVPDDVRVATIHVDRLPARTRLLFRGSQVTNLGDAELRYGE